MVRDWKNKKDYDYMDNHTPELWAWEFLRRNPEYRKDWKKALSSACFKENYQPEALPFESARSRWGLFIPEIINPDVDKPSVQNPNPSLFYTYGYYYDKDDLHLLPELKSSEVLALFDLAKPIQQQLEHFKKILEEDQKDSEVYSTLEVLNVKNKPAYRKDYIRILDALADNANIKEIASFIFPSQENSKPEYHGNRMVRDSIVAAKKFRDGMYRNFLQKPSEWKKI